MLSHLITYLLAFSAIWVGAGIAIKSIEQLSRKLQLPSFFISYIIVGFCASIGEISIGVNSLINQEPEIYVGTLIGASIVLFMLVIPLLVITSTSIQVHSNLQSGRLALQLVLIAAPVMLALDGAISRLDGLICIFLYMMSLAFMQSEHSFSGTIRLFAFSPSYITKKFVHVILGITLIFISSHLVVDETHYFADALGLSPFIMSLLVVAIGTNIPELSIVLRSYFSRNKQIALGTYIGSASMNTLIFGVLSVVSESTTYLTNSYLTSLVFFICALFLFYIFARSKNVLTRLEGVALISLYIIFVLTEVYVKLSSS